MQLVLASSSRYRRELLDRLGLPYIAIAPDIDESPHPGETPRRLVERLAEAKARAVARNRSGTLVIGSDQVAASRDRMLSKPGTSEAAIEQLTQLSGTTARFYTGLCLLNADTGSCRSAVESVDVEFRTLQPSEIIDYVTREQPLDCAGAFKSERLGIALVARIVANDPTTLVGLPLIRLVALLREEGVVVLARQ